MISASKCVIFLFVIRSLGIGLLATILNVNACIVIPSNQIPSSLFKYSENAKIDTNRTSYHETGHALVAYLLNFPITKVTIEPTNNYYLGHVDFRIKEHHTTENVIKVFLAGYVAEELLFGSAIKQMVDDDLEKTNSYLDKLHSNPEKINIKKEDLLVQYLQETRDLITQNYKLLEVLAVALQQQKTLTGNEVNNIINVFSNKTTSSAKSPA